MNPELRTHFGKVVYQAAIKENGPGIEQWENLSDRSKEFYCAVGEAAASELAGMLIPTFRQVLESFLSTIENFSPRNKGKGGQESI